MFLLIIHGATDKRAPPGLAFDCDWFWFDPDSLDWDSGDKPFCESSAKHGAIERLWLFCVAPIAGAFAGGAIYRWLSEE